MSSIPLRTVLELSIITILIILGMHVLSLIHNTESKYEALAENHLLYLMTMKPTGVFFGFCDDVATLLGVLNDLYTNESFTIIVYPTISHATVIVDNTEYTTILFDRPFLKFVYDCKVSPEARIAYLKNDQKKLIDLIGKGTLLVDCKYNFKKSISKINVTQQIIYGIEIHERSFQILTTQNQLKEKIKST